MEWPHWPSVDDLLERRKASIRVPEAVLGIGGALEHQVVDLCQAAIPVHAEVIDQAGSEAVYEQVDLTFVPADSHLDSRDNDHAEFAAEFDRAGNRALVVMICDGDDPKAAICHRVDEVVCAPEAVAGERVEMKIDRVT